MTADGALIFTQADWRTLDSLKIRNLSVLKGITDDMSKDILRELSDGINAGESIPKLTKRIQDVAGVTRARAERIARTESVNAAVDACRVRYEQAGVTEFEYIAASDDRLCAICASYNGKIYKLTDNEHLPPIHPNCRCAIAPVIGDRDELLKQQKEKEAAEALAKQKAKEEQEAAAAAAKAKEKAKAEELKKLKAEKKKAEAEAAKAKAEKEAAEAKLADAENKVFDGSARARVENPIIPYAAEFKKVMPKAVEKEPVEIPKGLYEHTGQMGNKEQNAIARGEDIHLSKDDYAKRVSEIKEVDAFLSDKRLPEEIELRTGEMIRPKKIFRGVHGDYAKDLLSKKAGDEIADEAIQSYSLSEDVSLGFIEKENTRVLLVQKYHPGDVGYYIGKASRYENEQEVSLPRGLIHVIEDIKPISKKICGAVLTYVQITVRPKMKR